MAPDGMEQSSVNTSFAMKVLEGCRGRWHLVFADPGVPEVLARLGPDAWSTLAEPGSGSVVKHARTSWVQRTTLDGNDYFHKTYVYPTRRDRRRGWLRTTWCARSRARREADAIVWLRCHGFHAPEAVAVAEARKLGVLHAAVVLTRAVAGAPLTTVLPRLDPAARDALLGHLKHFVSALHEAGFRDRNLDLRNILVQGSADAPWFTKIDSPRYRVRAAHRAGDRLARADWRRLHASLAELGLGWPQQA